MLTFLETLAVAVLHKGAEVRGQLIDKISKRRRVILARRFSPFWTLPTPSGLAFMLGASLIFGFVAFIALGAIGGALGASFLGRRDPP